MRASLWGVIGGFLLAVGFAFGYLHGKQAAEAARPKEEQAKVATKSRAAQGRLDKAALKEIERKLAERLEPDEGAAAPAKFDGSAKSLRDLLEKSGLTRCQMEFLVFSWTRAKHGLDPPFVFFDFSEEERQGKEEDAFRMLCAALGVERAEEVGAMNGMGDLRLDGFQLSSFSEEQMRGIAEIETRYVVETARKPEKPWQEMSETEKEEKGKKDEEIASRRKRDLIRLLGEDGYVDLELEKNYARALRAAGEAGISRSELRGWLKIQESAWEGVTSRERHERHMEIVEQVETRRESLLGTARYKELTRLMSRWYEELKKKVRSGELAGDPGQFCDLIIAWDKRFQKVYAAKEKWLALVEPARAELAPLIEKGIVQVDQKSFLVFGGGIRRPEE